MSHSSTESRFAGDVQRLMDAIDEGDRALSRGDAGEMARCTEAMRVLMEEMAGTWNGPAGLLSVRERAVAERLADLLRSAVDRVQRTEQQVQHWKQQTQDALRAITNGQEAIGRYADSLGAHRRELFDLSA
jgi:hypothetical protein